MNGTVNLGDLYDFIYGGAMLDDTRELGWILFQIARGMALQFGEIRALEIGVRQGGTTIPLLFGLHSTVPHGHLVSIDNDLELPNAYKVACANVERLGFEWELFLADSRTWQSPYSQYHLIYIDADHSYEGVRADFEKYGPLLVKDGLMLFHDAEDHPGTRRALDEKRNDWNIVTMPFSHGLAIARRK